MMQSLYVDTTIVSHLATEPSGDLRAAAREQATHDWWREAPNSFELFVSDAVIDELRQGDAGRVEKQLGLVAGLPIVRTNDEVRHLAREYESRLPFPGDPRSAPHHLALAVTFRLDIVVTWNFKSLANARVIRQLYELNDGLGLATPAVVTPLSLLESWHDPIVEEVHEIRAKMLEECGGDLRQLVDRVKSGAERRPRRKADET